MNSPNKILPITVALGFAFLVGAFSYLSATPFGSAISPAMRVNSSTSNALIQSEQQPAQNAPSFSPKVQKLIDSGALSPPPGNPNVAHSVVLPFNGTAIADATAQFGKRASRGRSSAQQDDATGATNLIGTVVASAASHTVTAAKQTQASSSVPPTPSINVSIHSTQTQPSSLAANQPIVFETPPGIGSAQGSR